MSTIKRISFQVLPVKQPIGDFYIASLKPQDVVEISYSDVRRLAREQRDVEKYLGIQRPINEKRVKEIKDYIDAPDSTFPTSVILAVDEKCVEYNSETGVMTLFEYEPQTGIDDEPVPYGKIAKILDGQHRIAGFLNEQESYAFDFMEGKEFDLNVALFIGADLAEQANIFATVNLRQTKVNRSLAYDLKGLAKTRSPFKTCHNVAVALDAHNDSPFYERIKRLGVVTVGREHETLTQAAFVETLIKFIGSKPMEDRNLMLAGKKLPLANQEELLKNPFRNMFIKENDIIITEILYNYFSAIRMKWPEAWNEVNKKGNILPRSNAFKAFMRYLLKDVYNKEKQSNEVPTSKDFLKYFDHVNLSDEDFTSKTFKPGSGGEAAFYKVLTGEKNVSDLID